MIIQRGTKVKITRRIFNNAAYLISLRINFSIKVTIIDQFIHVGYRCISYEFSGAFYDYDGGYNGCKSFQSNSDHAMHPSNIWASFTSIHSRLLGRKVHNLLDSAYENKL